MSRSWELPDGKIPATTRQETIQADKLLPSISTTPGRMYVTLCDFNGQRPNSFAGDYFFPMLGLEWCVFGTKCGWWAGGACLVTVISKLILPVTSSLLSFSVYSVNNGRKFNLTSNGNTHVAQRPLQITFCRPNVRQFVNM